MAVVGLLVSLAAGCGGEGLDKTDAVELNVMLQTHKPATCNHEGYMLIGVDSVPVYGCNVQLSSPPESLGCWVMLDHSAYDLTFRAKATARLGGTELKCAR